MDRWPYPVWTSIVGFVSSPAFYPRILRNRMRSTDGTRKCTKYVGHKMAMMSWPALALAVGLVLMMSGASADSLEVPTVSSDAWLRTGPSTSHEKITGLHRGTAVLEIANLDTAFEERARRWVHIHVLDGPAAGRQGWVWGRFISCCEAHDWLE